MNDEYQTLYQRVMLYSLDGILIHRGH
jgi:hypothetical protein